MWECFQDDLCVLKGFNVAGMQKHLHLHDKEDKSTRELCGLPNTSTIYSVWAVLQSQGTGIHLRLHLQNNQGKGLP